MWSSASGSDRSLRHQESWSSVWRRRGLCWPEWSGPPGLSWFLSLCSTEPTSVITWRSTDMRGWWVLSHNVQQQHHHLFAGLRSFSRESGRRRNVSVWKVANRSSRPWRPSSTSPVRVEWRVWSWECLTGTQVFIHCSQSLKMKCAWLTFPDACFPPSRVSSEAGWMCWLMWSGRIWTRSFASLTLN